MTEADWLECGEPREMFKLLRPRLSRKRKCRLFAVACCRAVRPGFPDPEASSQSTWPSVMPMVMQLMKNGKKAQGDANSAHSIAFSQFGKEGACLEWAAVFVVKTIPYSAAENVSWAVVNRREGFSSPDYSQQGKQIRDIFGNPFRPVTLLGSPPLFSCSPMAFTRESL
jgi:hypothetical protein